MAMVKWTDEGFKLIGRLLSNETVEEWFQSHGKELAESAYESIAMKWFFGRSRARKQAIREVLTEINASKPLRMALNESLNKLPKIVQRLARILDKKRIDVLTKRDRFRQLVIVPRALVIDNFAVTLLDDLADAAELKRFHALLEHFIQKQATLAEQAFRNHISKKHTPIVVVNSQVILGVDNQFNWNLKDTPGHYYYGYDYSCLADLAVDSDGKVLMAQLRPWLDDKKVQLRKLTNAEIDEIARHFFKESA
jgi:hypothetical protein